MSATHVLVSVIASEVLTVVTQHIRLAAIN